ncbi:hypothetical protein O1M54_06555 [Streptomyces diastatochromogenes]|nr:hypothetical protein [Streptomyces diastatochromogenes]
MTSSRFCSSPASSGHTVPASARSARAGPRQRERLAQRPAGPGGFAGQQGRPALCRQPLEPQQVDPFRRHPHHISGRLGHQLCRLRLARHGERPAQPPDRVLQDLACRARHPVRRPHRRQQAPGGHHLARVQQQIGQCRALPGAAESDQPRRPLHLEWSQ